MSERMDIKRLESLLKDEAEFWDVHKSADLATQASEWFSQGFYDLARAVPDLLAYIRASEASQELAANTAKAAPAGTDAYPLPPDHPAWQAADAAIERIGADEDAQAALTALDASLNRDAPASTQLDDGYWADEEA